MLAQGSSTQQLLCHHTIEAPDGASPRRLERGCLILTLDQRETSWIRGESFGLGAGYFGMGGFRVPNMHNHEPMVQDRHGFVNRP